MEWIDDKDVSFSRLFTAAVDCLQKRTYGNPIFASIMQQPGDESDVKQFAQYFTPADVALYSAYQLLKDFDYKNDVIFDPCAGKGGLLIAAGTVLAVKNGLRDETLLKLLRGVEISNSIYNETIENIIAGLSVFTTGVKKEKARSILTKNIVCADFLETHIPPGSYIIANPPYKEDKTKKIKNIWISFAEKISSDPNVRALGLIVPVSICSADRTEKIRKNIKSNFGSITALHHEIRPRPLFPKIEQRISIFTATKKSQDFKYHTTGFIGHKAGERIKIWGNNFVSINYDDFSDIFPKIGVGDVDFYVNQKLIKKKIQDITSGEQVLLWVRTTGRYKLAAQYDEPSSLTTKWKKLYIPKERAAIIVRAFDNGEALKWWKIFGDGRDISMSKFLNNYGVAKVERQKLYA